MTLTDVFTARVRSTYTRPQIQTLPEATTYRSADAETFSAAQYAAEEYELIATRGPVHYVLAPVTDETLKVAQALMTLTEQGLVRVTDNGSYQLA